MKLSPRPQCIITGCNLFVIDQMKFVHGDLHLIPGQAFIFAACMEGPQMEPAWHYRQSPSSGSKALSVISEDAIFHRRGVMVVGILAAELNAAALAYLPPEERALLWPEGAGA